MSKLRIKTPTNQMNNPRPRLRTLMNNTSRYNASGKELTEQSKIFQQTRCHTISSNQSQIQKELIFHKNVNQFRESYHDNNHYMLPFLASLRKHKDLTRTQPPKAANPEPFAAERQTHNQKIKKNISDIRAHPFRLSKINYRWHRRSGNSVKAGCQFECSLRMDDKKLSLKNPEQSTFMNTIAPIRLKMIEPTRYKNLDLVCQRQKRLFTLDD